MKKSIYFEILVDGFREKPFLIKSSLQGFEDALLNLKNKKLKICENLKNTLDLFFLRY